MLKSEKYYGIIYILMQVKIPHPKSFPLKGRTSLTRATDARFKALSLQGERVGKGLG